MPNRFKIEAPQQDSRGVGSAGGALVHGALRKFYMIGKNRHSLSNFIQDRP